MSDDTELNRLAREAVLRCDNCTEVALRHYGYRERAAEIIADTFSLWAERIAKLEHVREIQHSSNGYLRERAAKLEALLRRNQWDKKRYCICCRGYIRCQRDCELAALLADAPPVASEIEAQLAQKTDAAIAAAGPPFVFPEAQPELPRLVVTLPLWNELVMRVEALERWQRERT